jgi:hypothetical protein
LKEKVAAPALKVEITAVGIRHADHATTFYPKKLALTSPISGGRSVDIVRSRTKATELLLLSSELYYIYIFCFVKNGNFNFQISKDGKSPYIRDYSSFYR